ncbi:YafY family transcriptional regulator [Paenibacillus oenotherae]|uniref:YafY family transcriptional regulator n=1 Tax=Paenibacillus oenotherae TaxID=1435645 RepID=A0ABS7D916_9BACL|nr:YafY family protein [Paenibacillus oenotherae]MBW7476365.1 YafY family transcriptional regulator [Paenibacillus oenotherae]
MNKTDRQLAIILELQRMTLLRAEDLAATFETSVRTIYRDIGALCEAGVPIIGAPGQGYCLVEGYFLPPVSFTAEEAVTLLLGMDFIEQQFDAAYRSKASSSRGKLEVILPEAVRKEADKVRAGMRLITGGALRNGRRAEELALLRQAIVEERTIYFRYEGRAPGANGERITSREADPYGMVFVRGAWMLIAYCHLRRELRHFLLTRMKDIELLDAVFSRPSDFNLQTYAPPDDRNTLVRVLFRQELALKVKEYNYYYADMMEDTAEGLLVTLRVRKPEEVLHWVLGWGEGAVILSPDSLRIRAREEIESMLKRY